VWAWSRGILVFVVNFNKLQGFKRSSIALILMKIGMYVLNHTKLPLFKKKKLIFGEILGYWPSKLFCLEIFFVAFQN